MTLMRESDEIRDLLVEIRDAQREHLAEYRRVTEQSLELQRRAVMRQEQIGKLYRGVVLGGGVLIAGIVALIIYLLGKLRW